MGTARDEQIGARWLAREQREIGAAQHSLAQAERTVIQHDAGQSNQSEPPRYPLPLLMGQRALRLWVSVLGEYGLLPKVDRYFQ